MRLACLFAAIIVSTALNGCAEQSLPQFDIPVPVSVPSGKPAYAPRLTQSDSENAILSWMEHHDDAKSLHFSRYFEGEWLAPEFAITDASMFINWADLPAVTSIGTESLLAYWLSYTADAPYAYQVLTAHLADDGASWSEPVSPHTDGTPTEHGFVSSFSAANGTGLLWLDGRNTPAGGMTLRSATLAPDGSLSDEVQLDDMVCDCCQTDIAETATGPVAVYRDRTEDEVRDIYVSRHVDGKWLPGSAVSNDGWVIAGCPVNGPSIAAAGKQVVIAWFTAADNKAIVKVAVSNNAGKSFSEPLAISSKKVLGHVGVSIIDGQSYAVSWMERDKDDSYAIRLRAMTFDGQMGNVQTVGRTALARIVPQMDRVGDELVLAWTDTISDLNKVVSVKVKILGFYD